jgi:hypothetical protein
MLISVRTANDKGVVLNYSEKARSSPESFEIGSYQLLTVTDCIQNDHLPIGDLLGHVHSLTRLCALLLNWDLLREGISLVASIFVEGGEKIEDHSAMGAVRYGSVKRPLNVKIMIRSYPYSSGRNFKDSHRE